MPRASSRGPRMAPRWGPEKILPFADLTIVRVLELWQPHSCIGNGQDGLIADLSGRFFSQFSSVPASAIGGVLPFGAGCAGLDRATPGVGGSRQGGRGLSECLTGFRHFVQGG